MDFLSKNIQLLGNTFIVSRITERAIISGNASDKIGPDFSVGMHVYAISAGIESWGKTIPIVKNYLA